MKFTINRDSVLDALARVQSIVSQRTTLPVLSNVLITAEKGKLSLTTTDLEVSVRADLDADVAKSGATTLPAKKLYSMFRELPSQDVEVVVDDSESASISCGGAFFRIKGMSADDFPPLPEFDTGKSFNLDQGKLKEMLRRTMYAASSDETRYVLNGALFSFSNEKLVVVCTDGRRLALAEQELEFPKESECDIIIPNKTVNELTRTLSDEGELKILVADNQVAFAFGDMLVISKLIDGTFPNYRQVIPGQCDERITLEREALLNAARRSALVTTEQSNSVLLTFEKNHLHIVAETDIGEARESLPMKYGGKEMSISFNPGFIMDPLKILDDDEIYLELTDELSPGVIKCADPFLYVIMPMRTS